MWTAKGTRDPLTAVRVVRIHLIDGDEVYQHLQARKDALRTLINPLTATFTPQPPLTRPLEATTPLDLALEGPRYPRQADLGNWDHWTAYADDRHL